MSDPREVCTKKPEAPEGCVKTIEEIKVIIHRAHIEPIDFYLAGYSTGEVRTRKFDASSKLEYCERETIYKVHYRERDFYRPQWIGCSEVLACGYWSNPDRKPVRIFLNYWHAYAYALKCKVKR